VAISKPGVYTFGAYEVEIRAENEPRGRFSFDAKAVPLPWLLRAPRPGDRMHPRGLGGRKKLSDLFIDEKIPRESRPYMPVLEREGEILWTAGLRASEAGRPRSGSRTFLDVAVLTQGRAV